MHLPSRLPDPQRSAAVFIGCSRYVESGIPDLPAVSNNVLDLVEVLVDSLTGGLRRERCTIVENPMGKRPIGKALMSAAREAEDLFLVYYAGHGLIGPRHNDLYLGLSDTEADPDQLIYTAMPFEGLRHAFLSSAATSRVLILDCCFSGRAIEEHMADAASLVLGQVEVGGTYTLTSTPSNSLAFAPVGARHTAFTGSLLNILHEGISSAAELVSLGDLYHLLRRRMAAHGLPVPQQRGTSSADRLALVRNIAYMPDAGALLERTMVDRLDMSRQRFADLVAIAPVGIGLVDESARLIVDANEALCLLLGYEQERLRGMTLARLIHPEAFTTSSLLAGIDDAASGPIHLGQRMLSTASGRPIYVELSATKAFADDGKQFWLVIFSDVTNQRKAVERRLRGANQDELTKLPGRTAVKELLDRLLDGPDSARVVVLCCDVDNFARINDSLGHEVGDELIIALAQVLKQGLPSSCVAARVSGDEFVVICSNIDEVGDPGMLASQVATLLRAETPIRGQLLRISATIGVAVSSGPDTSAVDLLRYAEVAMYHGKRRGTGVVSVANEEMIASATNQMVLEGQLRDAISGDGLVVHYQPMIDADGMVTCAEALVRWPHPQRGLLRPGQFLPVAERGDLLRELDRWVLSIALREASQWLSRTGPAGGASVAVNLSGLMPGDPDFVDAVATAVAESGIDWNRVVLELAETSFIDLPQHGRVAMAELIQRGVRFAVDHFGVGNSSLARLKDLPAQIIKVDRRFVNGVASDSADFAIARAVADLARATGRSLVAQGVETAEQFHVLRAFGVDAYQGNLWAYPLPLAEFRDLLSRGPLAIPRA